MYVYIYIYIYTCLKITTKTKASSAAVFEFASSFTVMDSMVDVLRFCTAFMILVEVRLKSPLH